MSYRYPSISARLTGRKGASMCVGCKCAGRIEVCTVSARGCVRTPSLPESQLQRDNTTLCPWEVVKIPADMLSPFSPSFFLVQANGRGIHPFVYTRGIRAEHKIRRNEIASLPHRSVRLFARRRKIDRFVH